MDTKARQRLSTIVESGCERYGQRGYARKLGVSQNAVIGWLECRSVPTAENLRLIASEAGYTLDEFMDYLGSAQKSINPSEFDAFLKQMRKMDREQVKKLAQVAVDLLAAS